MKKFFTWPFRVIYQLFRFLRAIRRAAKHRQEIIRWARSAYELEREQERRQKNEVLDRLRHPSKYGPANFGPDAE